MDDRTLRWGTWGAHKETSQAFAGSLPEQLKVFRGCHERWQKVPGAEASAANPIRCSMAIMRHRSTTLSQPCSAAKPALGKASAACVLELLD